MMTLNYIKFTILYVTTYISSSSYIISDYQYIFQMYNGVTPYHPNKHKTYDICTTSDQPLRGWSNIVQIIYKMFCVCWDIVAAAIILLRKWNESGFRPPLCTYRLNWARRTSWGWWDDWDDTVLQTQDSKFEPWRSEAEHATSQSRRLPTILTFTRGWGRNIFVSFKPPRPGTEPRTLAWEAAVLTTTLGPPPILLRNECLGRLL